MPTNRTSALLLTPRMYRGAVARGLKSESKPIDRTGGDFGAGIIRGASLIARGEALGHGMWIDNTMLKQVESAVRDTGDKGTKGRFTHPGMSSDGLGKALGRWKNGRVDGDVTRADLHFYQSAHHTPDGDLAEYVMDLAEEDHGAFGVSIAFDPDFGEEDRFIAENEDAKGNFVSPDKDNEGNLPHARLAELVAADCVDEPAANPSGLFHRGDELAGIGNRVLSWCFGLSDAAPDALEIGIDPDRLRQFVQRYLQDNGLALFSTRRARERMRALELDGE